MSNNLHKQSGIALITALVTLLLATILGLSSLNSSVVMNKVSAGTREYYSAFQAAETALAMAQQSSSAFTTAMTSGTGTAVAVSMDPVADLYSNTGLTASVTYVSEGTLVANSSVGKFRPQYFELQGVATRTGSQAQTVHRQGYRVLAPSS